MAVFYVFQGITYDEEEAGGYVWSPQLTKNGKKNAGFTNMTKIKKGDFVLHNKNSHVVAISVAKSDCYEYEQPSELSEGVTNDKWNREGYRVDLQYFPFDHVIKTSDFKQWLIDNYQEDSAFTVAGKGKQQYMCTLAENQAIFLLKKAIEVQENKEVLFHLEGALEEIVNDKDSEYDQIEIEEINDQLEEPENIVVDKKITEANIQALTLSNATGRKIPKRNTKRAVDALKLADHKCEYNQEDRTFLRKNGKAYTEPHHLIPISKYQDFEYSVDVKENIVSLCSHCHNLLHYGKFEDKKIILNKLYNDRSVRLKEYGIEISLEQLEGYYK